MRRLYEEELSEFDRLSSFNNLDPTDPPLGLILAHGEEVYVVMPARLSEWRQQPGTYEGGGLLGGVSFNLPGTSSWRGFLGDQSMPQYVEGAEGWEITDVGEAAVTSSRIIFQSERTFHEWPFDLLARLVAYQMAATLSLHVKNRQDGQRLQLRDLDVFRLKAELAFRQHRGEPGLPLERPEPPPELEGSDLRACALDVDALVKELRLERRDIGLDRDDEVKSRLAQLKSELNDLQRSGGKGAQLTEAKRAAQHDVEAIHAHAKERQRQVEWIEVAVGQLRDLEQSWGDR
jgi:hypothetical protein